MIQAIGRVGAFSSLVTLSHTNLCAPVRGIAVVLATKRPHAELTVGRTVAMLACMVTARTAAMLTTATWTATSTRASRTKIARFRGAWCHRGQRWR